MKKIALVLLISFSFILSTEAMDHDSGQHAHEKGAVVNVKVHGMVCDFCATAIKKRFMKKKEVKDIKVDLDSMTISIEHMPGKALSEKTIKKEVKKSGYKYVGLIENKNEK